MISRGEYSFSCCCNRLNEFYDWKELDNYIKTIEDNNLNVHRAIKWLDEATRERLMTSDKPIPIENRALEYLVTVGEE